MLGTTLGDIRSHVESLASADGRYYLVCARHGDRPVPADGLRFETRETARAAARAAEQYRTALRRYDPRLPHYDVVVCQERQERLRVDRDADPATPESVDSLPTSGRDGRPRPTSRSVASPANARCVEFCHRVAAAVFEALSGGGHDAIESAVVDEYFELAERVTDLDDLCLCLLESIATEISRGLAPDEQARVVEAAASRLPTPDVDCHPAAATLASLRRRGMVGEYDWSVPTDQQGATGERSSFDSRSTLSRRATTDCQSCRSSWNWSATGPRLPSPHSPYSRTATAGRYGSDAARRGPRPSSPAHASGPR